MKKSKSSKSNSDAEPEVVIHGPTLHTRVGTERAFNRREFLADAVAGSYKGQFVDGFNSLVLCDGSRIFCLEFPLATPQARNASLRKIGNLLGTLEKFR